jgi:hypothetical protein
LVPEELAGRRAVTTGVVAAVETLAPTAVALLPLAARPLTDSRAVGVDVALPTARLSVRGDVPAEDAEGAGAAVVVGVASDGATLDASALAADGGIDASRATVRPPSDTTGVGCTDATASDTRGDVPLIVMTGGDAVAVRERGEACVCASG